MLPAAHRLRSAADFRITSRQGRRSASGPVVVHLLPGQPGPARAGVVVPRSVGGSVVRHRVARRIRGGLTSLVPSMAPGTLVVVRALPGAGTDPRLGERVRSAVQRALASG